MSTITTRAAKGSALTHAEVDANFTNLNTGKAEVSGQTFTGNVVLPAGSATAGGVQVGTGTTFKPAIYSPGTDQLAISTGGTGRLFVDASGRVGIGTSSPVSTLDVNGNISFSSSGIVGPSNLNITTDTTQQYYFGLARGNTLARFNGIKVYNNANGSGGTPASRIGFYTDKTGGYPSTERLTITEDGFVSIGATSPNTSGAKLQTVDGLTFPATQVASADPNTLDDYEEGTWTPTVIGNGIAGTATYSLQAGTYTKVGRKVTVMCSLVYSGGTGTGTLNVGGFPFLSANITNNFPTAACILDSITTAANSQAVVTNFPGNASAAFQSFPMGGGTAANVSYDAAGSIYFSLTYFAT